MIDTDCTTCGGLGTLGCDPETCERIYCDACVYGVTLHLEDVSEKGDDLILWLLGREHEGGWFKPDVALAQAHLDELNEKHSELCVKLDTLKQDETNRPRAHLFEDA